jgi:hypothetical protein
MHRDVKGELGAGVEGVSSLPGTRGPPPAPQPCHKSVTSREYVYHNRKELFQGQEKG